MKFDPTTAKPDDPSDEYSSLLERATLRALQSEAVKALTAKLEKRQEEMQAAYDKLVADIEAERSAMKKEHATVLETMKEHEKRIHQIASRPQKDPSPAILNTLSATTSDLCASLEKLAKVQTDSVCKMCESMAEEPEEEDDDEDEVETPAPAPKPKSYDIVPEYNEYGVASRYKINILT